MGSAGGRFDLSLSLPADLAWYSTEGDLGKNLEFGQYAETHLFLYEDSMGPLMSTNDQYEEMGHLA